MRFTLKEGPKSETGEPSVMVSFQGNTDLYSMADTAALEVMEAVQHFGGDILFLDGRKLEFEGLNKWLGEFEALCPPGSIVGVLPYIKIFVPEVPDSFAVEQFERLQIHWIEADLEQDKDSLVSSFFNDAFNRAATDPDLLAAFYLGRLAEDGETPEDIIPPGGGIERMPLGEDIK